MVTFLDATDGILLLDSNADIEVRQKTNGYYS